MLRKVEQIIDIDLNKASIINAGVSNTTYLINDKYIYRAKSKQNDSYKNRYDELEAIKQLDAWDKTEKVLSFDPLTGEKLSLYIKDTYKQHEPPTQLEMKKTARLLKEFHSLNLKIDNEFNAIKRYKYYRDNSDQKLDTQLENNLVTKIDSLYHKYPLIVCHNDLVNNNFLFSENKDYLIDFEFISKNIVQFDLASYLSENNIRKEKDIEYFLNCYDPNIDINEIKLMMTFEDLLWFYWANFNYKHSKKEIYKIISKEKRSHLSAFYLI